MTRALLIGWLAVASVVPAVAGQTAKPDAKPAAPQPPEAAPPSNVPAPPTPPANYAYAVDGRRDPFVPLLGTSGKKGTAPVEVRAEGVAGLGTDELSVKGILLSQGQWVAMIAGPSGKVFTVQPGARLADGTVRTITPQFVVILQQVNDPLSLEKQREVRKFLRGGETK
jgi:Tfp pilus assembly protein PilP